MFTDSLYVESPYASQKQEIRYKFPSSTVFSFPDISPHVHSDAMLTYGPFPSVSAFAAVEEVRLHFPSIAKFRTLETVEREVEVSQWGNVAFEEVIRATAAVLSRASSRDSITTKATPIRSLHGVAMGEWSDE